MPGKGQDVSGGTAPALGRSVVRGSSWVIASSLVSRGAGFLAQVGIGYFLTPDDLGVYASAIAASSVLTVLRDGGVRHVLISRPRDFDRLMGPAFWIASCFALLTALVLALYAGLNAAWKAGDVDGGAVAAVLLVIAASQPLSVPGAILSARLQVDLRFGAFTAIQTVMGLMRYGGTVLLAWAGLGPLSFVIPLIPMSLLEWAWAWRLTGRRPWREGARLGEWRGLLTLSWWVVGGSAGIAAINAGVPMVVNRLMPIEVVGVYYFAQQIVAQIGIVLAASLGQVLFPAFSRIAEEPERKAAAALRAMRQLMLAASAACAGLAAVYAPLERILSGLWGDKWRDSVPVLIVLAASYPINVATAVPNAVQQARRDFRGYGLGMGAVALLVLGASGLAAWWWGTALGVAGGSSAAVVVGALVYTVVALRPLGIGATAVLGALGPGWMLGWVAAGAVMAADRWLMAGWPVTVRFVVCGTCFGVAYAVLVRVTAPGLLREAVAVLPGGLGARAAYVLALRTRGGPGR